MARKDDVESVEPSKVEPTNEVPVQVISDSEAIHYKLNRIIELLTKE